MILKWSYERSTLTPFMAIQVDGAYTVQPRLNEPLYNEVLSITNDILQPGLLKRPRYNKPISLVPWHFVKLSFHCICFGEWIKEI